MTMPGTTRSRHDAHVKYNFIGFSAPVDRPNTMNVSKAGQAIPLKWRLTTPTAPRSPTWPR